MHLNRSSRETDLHNDLQDDHCACDAHHDATARARRNMAAEADVVRAAEMFKAMGDPSRLRILAALAAVDGEELCVCAICDLLDVSQSAVSHQLRHLRNLRLVKARRQGKWMFYSLDDDHVRTLMAQGLCHAAHGCGPQGGTRNVSGSVPPSSATPEPSTPPEE